MHFIPSWIKINQLASPTDKARAPLCCKKKKKDMTTLATVCRVTRSFPFQADRWNTENRRRSGRSITLSTSPNQLGASSMLQLCNVSLATCSWVNQRSVQTNISSPVTFLLDDNPRVRTIFIMLTLRVSITLLQDYRGTENTTNRNVCVFSSSMLLFGTVVNFLSPAGGLIFTARVSSFLLKISRVQPKRWTWPRRLCGTYARTFTITLQKFLMILEHV